MDNDQIKILEDVAETLNRYSSDIVLCGGTSAHALAYHFNAIHQPTFTEDVDIVIERRKFRQKVIQTSSDQLSQELKAYGYKPTIKSTPFESSETPPEMWEKPSADYYFEFLTDDSRKKNHRIAGVVAQGFRYFNLSLENRIKVQLPSGNSLPVVSPAAFIIHKLLTYKSRIGQSKKIKDLYYITYVIQFILKGPEKAMKAIDALNIPNKWLLRGKSHIREVYDDIDSLAKLIVQSDEFGAFNQKAVKAIWTQLTQLANTAP
jgi:hypothetical protein